MCFVVYPSSDISIYSGIEVCGWLTVLFIDRLQVIYSRNQIPVDCQDFCVEIPANIAWFFMDYWIPVDFVAWGPWNNVML